MIRTSRTKAAIAAVTIAGATAAAMLVPASPAVAFSSGGLVLDVKVQSPAHLIAKGAAIGVPVEYTCFNASFASLSLSVTERVGGAIANGFGQVSNLVCTGEIQSLTVDVPAAPGGRAFTTGSAFAAADIFGCFSICGQQDNSRTITIQR